MTYKETLDWLFQQLPMFQNAGAKAIKKDLTNIKALCNLIDNPQNQYKTIHIAGTNGKGTVSHLIASVLQSAGYKCGLYTSPHYKDFRERIKVNGEYISEDHVLDFINNNREGFQEVYPSFFEWTVALAFDFFKSQEVDVAVIETGLGGRLDSTNIIHPELSVITNISFDHVKVLGDNIPKIAFEKAGIIKESIPVVIGEPNTEALPVFQKVAEERNSKLTEAYKEVKAFWKEDIDDFSLYDIYNNTDKLFEKFQVQLRGPFVRRNLITALHSCLRLRAEGWKISDEHIRQGFENVRSQSNYIGRWQILGRRPLMIADSGHNEAAIEQSLNYIKSIDYQRLHIVLGFVKDKNIESMLAMFPKEANYYFTAAQLPRALDAELLAESASKFDLKGRVFNSVSKAIDMAKTEASDKDLIFIGGSSFIVAEAL